MWDDFIDIQTSLLNEGIKHNRGTSVGDDLQTTLNLLLTGSLQMPLICKSANITPSATRSANFYDASIIGSIDSVESIDSIAEASLNSVPSQELTPMDANDLWTPTSGSALAQKTILNGKEVTYMQADYSLNSEAVLSWFRSTTNCAIEADITFYNYDGQAVSTRWD